MVTRVKPGPGALSNVASPKKCLPSAVAQRTHNHPPRPARSCASIRRRPHHNRFSQCARICGQSAGRRTGNPLGILGRRPIKFDVDGEEMEGRLDAIENIPGVTLREIGAPTEEVPDTGRALWLFGAAGCSLAAFGRTRFAISMGFIAFRERSAQGGRDLHSGLIAFRTENPLSRGWNSISSERVLPLLKPYVVAAISTSDSRPPKLPCPSRQTQFDFLCHTQRMSDARRQSGRHEKSYHRFPFGTAGRNRRCLR